MKIYWIIHAHLQDLLTGHPDLTTCLPFELGAGWDGSAELFKRLERHRFDIAIDLVGLPRIMSTLVDRGARWQFGIQSQPAHGAGMLPMTTRQIPAHARFMNVALSLGCRAADFAAKFHVPPTDTARVNELLANIHGPFLAVHASASSAVKRWPAVKFAGVLDRAIQQYRIPVVLTGNKLAKPDAALIMEQLTACGHRTGIVNLTGLMPIKQTISVYSRAFALISNDSGPLHLAAALGRPTLGIFTCTDPVISGPPGEQHELIQAPVPCAGSYFQQCPYVDAAHHACFGADNRRCLG